MAELSRHLFCVSAGTNDHAGLMQQVGAFRKSQEHLRACGLTPEADAQSTKFLQEAYVNAMNVCLQDIDKEFSKKHPRAHAGIMEGLKCVSSSGFHIEVPGLTKLYVQGMIRGKVLEDEKKEKTVPEEPNSTAVREAIANRLDHIDPEKQNKLLGFIAALSAYYTPKFAKCSHAAMRAF